MFPLTDEDQAFVSQDLGKNLSLISLMWLVKITRFVLPNKLSQKLDLRLLHIVG